jgi:F-type H+-transporting ATPase subunit delta
MIRNKRTKREARTLFRLCVIDGGMVDDARARLVARRLAASGRRTALPLLSEFARLVRLEHDRRSALVESAAPLSDGIRERVQADLTRLYGRRVSPRFEANPALIGGMRVTIGSDVYDGSVRARLAALERRW